MRISIVDLVKVEVRSWESDVWLCIAPYCQGIPVSDEDPLTNVKLPALHNQCILNVLLADILCLFLFAQVKDFDEISLEADTSTP